jgi:hypothetical protein
MLGNIDFKEGKYIYKGFDGLAVLNLCRPVETTNSIDYQSVTLND